MNKINIKFLLENLKEKLRRLLYKVEVDRAVFFGVLTRMWSLFAGPLTALLVVLKFNPELQGYYYTFGSLLALQIFVELGLGTVIIQFASHEWSQLRLDENGEIIGDNKALSRLVSLANIIFKWYVVSGIITAFGLGVGGYIFFLHSHTLAVNWVFPWFFLCFFTGVTICLIPIWSLLEGCNQVSTVYTYRFFQGIVASIAIWVAIFLGARLWAASISVLASILCAVLFLRKGYFKFIKSLLFTRIPGPHINWRKDVFPMQWRIALSWISSYFVFSLFTPVIFHYYGPVVAGQFGMTWSVIGMVPAISGQWLPPKVPRFGMLIAKKNYAELDSLFGRTTKIFVIITIFFTLVAWFAIYLLNKLSHTFAARLLPVLPTTVFLIAQSIMVLSMPFSAYMRAHKKEPLLFVSLCAGVLTAFVTFVLGRYSVTAIGLGYLATNILLVPLTFLIWHHCRIKWHNAVE